MCMYMYMYSGIQNIDSFSRIILCVCMCVRVHMCIIYAAHVCVSRAVCLRATLLLNQAVGLLILAGIVCLDQLMCDGCVCARVSCLIGTTISLPKHTNMHIVIHVQYMYNWKEAHFM